MSEKIIDLIWSLDIEKMNDHLPSEQKTLFQLLQEDKPFILNKKKQKHIIKKKDLDIIAELIPEEEWENTKLPIVLLRRTSLGKRIYSISGGIIEIYIIYKIANKTSKKFSEFKFDDPKPYIWKPEAFTAVRKIGSVVIIGYV